LTYSVPAICNLALARLGDKATVSSIDPPEGSAQASHCATFYPLARDIALEARRWGFNTTRDSTPALMENPQPGWRFAYALPNQCMKVLKVVPAQFADRWWATDICDHPFKREIEELTQQELILSNVPNAVIIYQRYVDDTTKFPPQFISAMAWLLASYLAGPIVKGDAGRKAGQAAYQAYTLEISQAATLDAQQNKPRQNRVPDSIRARMATCPPIPAASVAGPYGCYAVDNSWIAYPDGIDA
jgi:hypothetical protein